MNIEQKLAALKLEKLKQRDQLAEAGGGEERRAREHKLGKMTARERIAFLLDDGSFEETDKFVTHRTTEFGMAEQVILGDGFVTGYGRIDGRLVFLFAQDFTVFGGSLSETNAAKVVKIMEQALRVGARVKITIITRKSYGGAYCVMNSKQIRADVNYAWPTAEIAVMGPEGAVNIVYRREHDRAAKEGADGLTGEEAVNKLRAEKIEEFRDKFANPYIAAERGYVDAVIRPRDTRKKIIQSLEMLDGKRDKNPAKKHGNIPL